MIGSRVGGRGGRGGGGGGGGALGGFGNAYYQHAVEIEVYVEEGDAAARDAAFDALLQQIGRRSKTIRPSAASPSA